MKRLFLLPDFHDENKQRVGQYLNVILWSSIALLFSYYTYRMITNFDFSSPTNVFLSILVAILIILRFILHYGYVRPVSLILVTITWAAMTYQAYSNDGIRDVTITAYIAVILLASLLLGWRYSLPFFGLTIAALWIIANAEETGIKSFTTDTPINSAGGLSVIFSLIFVITYLIISSLQQSLQKANTSAQELMVNNKELQALRVNLEQRVAERTKALATSAEVTRRLATVLDPRQLVSEVVNEVRTAFGYYYAQIYLLDETGESLVMAGGTGEAGATMLARGHSLPKGRGLVGRAAYTNTSVLIPDVSQEEGWLPNDLLPETKAEAAVPIFAGNQVLGVLDVQHNVVNGLTAEDVTLLESLAGQVAITLQNARAYEESRRQAELESLINAISQKIQRTTTMEDTLQTAIREIGSALGASRVSARIATRKSAGSELIND